MKNNKLRLLIVGNKTRFVHLKQFIIELEKIGIESKLIYDIEFIDKFLQVNIKKKIEKCTKYNMIISQVCALTRQRPDEKFQSRNL